MEATIVQQAEKNKLEGGEFYLLIELGKLLIVNAKHFKSVTFLPGILCEKCGLTVFLWQQGIVSPRFSETFEIAFRFFPVL